MIGKKFGVLSSNPEMRLFAFYLHANALGKGMNPSFIFPNMGK